MLVRIILTFENLNNNWDYIIKLEGLCFSLNILISILIQIIFPKSNMILWKTLLLFLAATIAGI